MSFDHLMGRVYDVDHYNCAHFVCEAWQYETGQDLAHRMQGFLKTVSDRKFLKTDMQQFTKLTTPVSPCVVVFHMPRESPHVGLFIRGKVIHISRDGVKFQSLDVVKMGFKRVSYYQ